VPAEESTAAIVLRARDYSESDRIVTMLTREFGKLSGIAKGAKASRRRFERKLEPFSHVNLFFRRRPHGQLVFITRAEPGDSAPPTIEDDLAKIALGSYMLELEDALTSEEAEAVDAYHVLARALETLGSGAASLAMWWALDRTWQGVVAALATALGGCATEVALSHAGLFHYTHPDVLGLAQWLPWNYVAAAVGLGNVGRWLAEPAGLSGPAGLSRPAGNT